MAEWTEAEAKKAVAALVRRSQTDPEFRRLALRDVKAAIAQITSTPIPAGYKIRVVENAGADLTVVLPDPVASEDLLSTGQLEAVAGAGECGTSEGGG